MCYDSGEGESEDRGEISATTGHYEGAPVRDQRRQPQPPAGKNFKVSGLSVVCMKMAPTDVKTFC